jgi:hypothetical protein
LYISLGLVLWDEVPSKRRKRNFAEEILSSEKWNALAIVTCTPVEYHLGSVVFTRMALSLIKSLRKDPRDGGAQPDDSRHKDLNNFVNRASQQKHICVALLFATFLPLLSKCA